MIRNYGALSSTGANDVVHAQTVNVGRSDCEDNEKARLSLLSHSPDARAPGPGERRAELTISAWLDCQASGSVEDVDKRQAERNALWVTGPGMLSAFFNLVLINTAKPLMRADYGSPSVMQESVMTSASLAGAMLGQVALGSLADGIGRKKASLLSASLTALGAAGTALARPYNHEQRSIYTIVAAARFLLGIGVGGDYPILASITAENAPAKDSANALIRNSIMIGLGAIAAQTVYALLIPVTSPEAAWRSTAALGALLSLSMVAMRQSLLSDKPVESGHRIDEGVNSVETSASLNAEVGSPDFEQHSAGVAFNITQGDAQAVAPPRIDELWKPLVATSSCWMLYDIVDFSLGMYSSDILGAPQQPEDGALMTMGVNVTTLAGALMAYKLISSNQVGRNSLQSLGFAGLAACHLLLATGAGHFWHDDVDGQCERHLSFDGRAGRIAFLSLYALQQLFDAAGPAIGIYIIPAEIFPTATRATCMGIASSAGKLGAVLGSAAMPYVRNRGGLPLVFVATGLLSALGALITHQSVPKYGAKTLENIEPTYKRGGPSDLLRLLYGKQEMVSDLDETAAFSPV